MRLKLFLLCTLMTALGALAQTSIRGRVIDASTGQPVKGVTVLLDNQGNSVTTGPSGDFEISGVKPGSDIIMVLGYGYKDFMQQVNINDGAMLDLGVMTLQNTSFEAKSQDFDQTLSDAAMSESELEDEEGNTQEVALLSGATDNPFYNATSYTFSIMRFRIRGYDNQKTSYFLNGVPMNDGVRGTFNFSMTGGLNQAFKRRVIGMGLEETSYGFGGIGGANNFLTFAKDYAPGFRASVAYTNSTYRWRGMVTYATGLNKHGWALTLSAVIRYAKEGIYPGTFYNSWGYFASLQKVFNEHHSLALTTFGAPTKRAGNTAVFAEACELVGDNKYTPDWGYQEGKKRNARVVEAFDPTVSLNWLWTPKTGTSLNTGFVYHKSFYSKAALNWHDAADPRPDYYRYLPSYYTDDATKELYTWRWQSCLPEYTQIDWDRLYNENYMNTYQARKTGVENGSTYILEKRHSNQSTFVLSSILNTRLSDITTLQGGINTNYTISSYYKTIKDLLGGEYWLDVDQYSERDFPDDADMAQNDLNNPNRKVKAGDRFGYDYNFLTWKTDLWAQAVFNLPKWDFFLSGRADYFTFQRDGKMRNGRAPENSYGKGKLHKYFTAGAKAGITFKLDGRNSFTGHAYYGNEAPRPYDAYISPRIKDDVISNLHCERVFAADLSYNMSYRNFKAVITGFFADQRNATERTAFYDDLNSTFMNYALTGVHKQYKGIEIGLSYKLSSSLTLKGAANIARYQYKNRPTGTRSYENGSQPDVTQTVYLKNYYVSGTPQEAYTIGLNWAGPKMWFVEVNGAWMGHSYVSLSPIRHEAMENLYTKASSEAELKQMIADIATQERLNEAFVVNASIGHVIYLNRSSSLNINLNITNLLNNKNIQTGGYQQGRFDYKNYTTEKYPNKYYYAQGFRMYLNVGVKF